MNMNFVYYIWLRMRRTTKSKAMSVFLPVLCFAFVYVAITQVNLVRRQQRQKTVALKHFNQNFSDSKLSTSLFPSSNFDQLSGNVTRLNRREKTKTKEVAPTVTAAAYISGRYLRKQVTLQTSPVSSQLTCKQLKLLMNKTRKNANSEFRKENALGGRGIYFTSMRDQDDEVIKIALKIATIPKNGRSNYHQLYKYECALKEIKALQKLQKQKWKGVPRLHGACITPDQIIYAVSRVEGKPICSGVGVNIKCFSAKELMSSIGNTTNPAINTLKFLSKLTCFFEQFERDHVFMEDMTGSNLFYSERTFDVYLVDADSLIFYGDAPLRSRTSCTADSQCFGITGNYWYTTSLNRKLYLKCQEFKGYCFRNTCSGLTAALHACGVGAWLVSTIEAMVPERSRSTFRKISKCLTAMHLKDRCSFETACEAFYAELALYERNQQQTTT